MKLTDNIDKFGTVGLFLTAIFSPCCFPLFAFGASAIGLGTFEMFGGWTMWVFQIMVIVSIVGLAISFRKHRSWFALAIAIPSALFIFYGYHSDESNYWTYFIYVGMFGLLIATGVNYYQNKQNITCTTCLPKENLKIELLSTITCPTCGYQKEETMPTNACSYFYECAHCKTVLKPLSGDCCVYCSYGNVKCPPIQAGINCC